MKQFKAQGRVRRLHERRVTRLQRHPRPQNYQALRVRRTRRLSHLTRRIRCLWINRRRAMRREVRDNSKNKRCIPYRRWQPLFKGYRSHPQFPHLFQNNRQQAYLRLFFTLWRQEGAPNRPIQRIHRVINLPNGQQVVEIIQPTQMLDRPNVQVQHSQQHSQEQSVRSTWSHDRTHFAENRVPSDREECRYCHQTGHNHNSCPNRS